MPAPRKEVPKMADKKTVHRDSKSGEFVTPDYAKKHPSTTEKERVKK
jgi:hypothetical protein